MLRNDLFAGLMVWLPNNDENREVLILDHKRNNQRNIVPGVFEVYTLTKNGDVKFKHSPLELKDAFFRFLEMVE